MSFMKYAIDEAKKALSQNQIPIGVVIVEKNNIILSVHNNNDTLGHAEILAINSINKRCDNMDIYVTLEPCPMCAGAIMQARFRRVYFGAYNKIAGGFGTVIDVTKAYNNKIEIYGGIMELECQQLIKNYFQNKRG